MRFFFTEEDDLTRRRAADIRTALVHARHEVAHGRPGDSAPAGTDVWMHGLGADDGLALQGPQAGNLLASSARVVLFQACDAESMWFHRIPGALAERSQLFLRNHWPSDASKIPAAFRGRTGWLPAMMEPVRASRGKPLADRPNGAIFFGSRTGAEGVWNSREETVRIMRSSGLPFVGGLARHAEMRYHTDPALLVPRISRRAHNRLLRESKICLAPRGNHPLTYRLFEGIATRCLVLAQPLRGCRFLDAGLEPGKHYVEIAEDLGDLRGTVDHYLKHLDAAQRIADAGHEHFRRYFAFRGALISKWMFDATVASWGALYRRSEAISLVSAIRSAGARRLSWRY